MSSELLKRTRAALPSWLAIYYDEPIELERGEGRHVWDADGNRYLDFFGGILTTMTAHALPEVTKAVADQAGKIVHSSTLYLNRPMVELAEQIAAVSEIPDAKVFLTPSGTEANDAALLLASSLRRSNQILALRNSNHGRSFSTIAITGNRSWSPTSLSPFQTYYVHGGQQYRSPFAGLSDGEYIAACVADLREVLDQAGGDVAAFIAEPVQGVGGFTSGPDGLLGAFAEVLREKGILWISDEVQTGWGRTGEHFWGWQASGGTPDLVTFAKGIGNGLSMGGVIAPAAIMDSLGANHISTFGGSPLTSAGALANLRYLLENDLQANAAAQGPALFEGLRALGSPIVGDVRGKGLMLGVELVRPGTGTPGDPAPELAGAVLEGCKRRGLLVGKGGLHGNVLRIAPPLTLTAEEAAQGLAALLAAIEEAS
ncbi:aspartate aminotransferase family protein [Pseudonocardia sp. KRD-184]|uniref:Aspartate aminotransferase family protein n=1 Tax=Pseudonocardia oceani TaxID=2792013 RepID=A0ABS6UCW9_9PSEU|nr:aspartate aminotransferase family protein [Pseudonocardia oceani]MBW0090786.1 aspartate aminotransferase family protein [Pseudonocardia oceani]MBW0095749.1 aspartate aminotransferase family protein [Pseudonocardia oceani]MBW0108308.1 aspartate aminotransferase family protein [Pseudonocardia oceani]MBW0121395.1 aspartate aminotransferase family protein [Pseudonocardia oceani]MBW0130087.1 aspartate aminotransferase family protein [Pseudonocardia oceani]